jgi:membrane associated rhomboid family serine protease
MSSVSAATYSRRVTTVPAPASGKRINRVLPAQPMRAGVVILAFTALLYVIQFVNMAFLRGRLAQDGIISREVSGLPGILWAPLLHKDWPHLFSNTVPVLLFGFLVMAVGLRAWIVVTATIWLISGIGVWLTEDAGVSTVGASGVAFGWLAFLLVRGLFNRSVKQLLVAAILFFYWGSVLFGALPGIAQGVSWQAHLFGLLGGLLTAWMTRNAGRITPPTAAALPGNLGV